MIKIRVNYSDLHFLRLFICSLFLSPTAEICASFLSSLILWSSLTGQFTFAQSIKNPTQLKYNLPFALKGKPLLAKVINL